MKVQDSFKNSYLYIYQRIIKTIFMKKITFKISAFLLFAMVAFNGHAQVTEIVEGTKYNLRNVGTGKYLQAASVDGKSTYTTVGALVDGEVTFNFFFNHNNTIDPGGDGVVGTDDDVVHNYTDDWNIGNDTRGIMRSDNTALVHTNFKYNIWNANGGHKTDKRWVATTIESNGMTLFRFAALVSGATSTRYLFDDDTGTMSNITEADMGNATDASYWVLSEATDTLLSTKNFQTSSIIIANPVNNELRVQGLNEDINKLTVYNLLGSKVLSKKLNKETSVNLNVSGLNAGMYIVKLEGSQGAFSKKIIKE